MENINKLQITKQNIYAVPKDWIIIRHQVLQKNIRSGKVGENLEEVMQESEIIKEYLGSHHKKMNIHDLPESNPSVNHLSEADQLEMDIPVLLKNQYVPIVEDRLNDHYVHMLRKESLERQIEVARASVAAMPKITANYDSTGGGFGGGLPQSPTEMAVMRPIERLERLRKDLYELEESMYTMNYVLQELKPEQFELVKAMFFTRHRLQDNVLMGELHWGRKKFYSIKKATFIRIAYKLKII